LQFPSGWNAADARHKADGALRGIGERRRYGRESENGLRGGSESGFRSSGSHCWNILVDFWRGGKGKLARFDLVEIGAGLQLRFSDDAGASLNVNGIGYALIVWTHEKFG
jgi:hypothetical protein